MDKQDEHEGQSGGVNISGGSVHAGGDIVGGDKITHGDNLTMGNVGAGGSAAVGRGASAGPSAADLAQLLADWQAGMNGRIDAHPGLSTHDKRDLKEQVGRIGTEAAKGPQANSGRLEKLINGLAAMAPDIFEVALTTLANPLAGLGLVAKKIGDRAKLESRA